MRTPKIAYYRTCGAKCATLRVVGSTGHADPCYIIPDADWTRFLHEYYAASKGNDEFVDLPTVFVFDGVPFRLQRTGGDGIFYGVAVDAGLLAEFPLELAKNKFNFEMKDDQ